MRKALAALTGVIVGLIMLQGLLLLTSALIYFLDWPTVLIADMLVGAALIKILEKVGHPPENWRLTVVLFFGPLVVVVCTSWLLYLRIATKE